MSVRLTCIFSVRLSKLLAEVSFEFGSVRPSVRLFAMQDLTVVLFHFLLEVR